MCAWFKSLYIVHSVPYVCSSLPDCIMTSLHTSRSSRFLIVSPLTARRPQIKRVNSLLMESKEIITNSGARGPDRELWQDLVKCDKHTVHQWIWWITPNSSITILKLGLFPWNVQFVDKTIVVMVKCFRIFIIFVAFDPNFTENTMNWSYGFISKGCILPGSPCLNPHTKDRSPVRSNTR